MPLQSNCLPINGPCKRACGNLPKTMCASEQLKQTRVNSIPGTPLKRWWKQDFLE